MTFATLRTLHSEAQGLASRFRRDKGGVAAVEFAMIVPLMFMLFVGSIEFSQALTVDRRVTQSASSTADLIARAPVGGLSTADVDGQMQIIKQLIEPYDLSRLTVKIFSVKASTVAGSTTYKVDWSRDNNGATPMARNATYTAMPANLIASGESVIIAEASYNYAPIMFKHFITTAFEMKEKFYLKPRNSSCVHLKPINCVTGGSL